MKIRSILQCVFVLGLCSCTIINDRLSAINETSAVMGQTAAPMIGEVPLIDENSALGADHSNLYDVVDLDCDTYIKTSWGNGAHQWGDPRNAPAGVYDLFPHLVFDHGGNFYLLDIPNHRLLKYDGVDQNPVLSIDLPQDYLLTVTSTPVVMEDRILVNYNYNRLGVLSLDGQVMQELELPFPTQTQLPIWTNILADEQGGLIINGEKLAYFSDSWELGQWDEISSTSQWSLQTPFIWNGYYVNQLNPTSGQTFQIYLRKIDPSSDFLNTEPDIIDTGISESASTLRLLGMDQEEWIYFGFYRYSVTDHQGQEGKLPANLVGRVVQYDVSPTGMLYLIIYDPGDTSVEPGIVRCRFPALNR